MQKQDKINLSEIDRALEGNIAGADQLRAQALSGFASLRQTKEKMLVREQTRSTLKLGPDHPKLAAIANQIAVNRGLHNELVMETERAKTGVPSVGPEAWLLHGYVRNEDGKAAMGLTVALHDRQGFWAKDLGHACTDAKGYFKLQSENVKDNKIIKPVYLRVLNSQGHHLYIDEKSLTPTAGQVDYREITLSGTIISCAPPPSTPCTPSPSTQDKPVAEPEPIPNTGSSVVQGRISDSHGQGLPGLIVSVYDKDFLFEDRLGSTETNQDGDYRLIYHTTDFRDLFERNPDLYLKITDRSGKLIYSSGQKFKLNAGRIETINVTLPPGGKKSIS